MEQLHKTPKNLEECDKIAWCFECIYYEEKLKVKIPENLDPNVMCPKKREFKTGINQIFFLSFDPPL